jgi:cytochrome c-type biogenesis protein CcmH
VSQLNAMVDKLAERMNKEPQNIEGWTQLGRAYALMQRFEEASKANQHAIAISPPNAQLLVDQADVLAMLQGQETQGEPERLIAQALKIDPRNVKALAMAGSVAFEHQDFARAVQHWAQALPLAPKGSDLANMLESSLAAARSEAQAAGQTVPAGSPTPVATAPAKATQLTGTVRLAPALASRVSPGDTLFIFARAAQGPRMPLAIVRTTAQQLPMSFTLDDSTAMSPQSKLSQFEQVIVGARLSKSGQALPQSGDLIGQSAPTSHTSQGLEITIDSVQP